MAWRKGQSGNLNGRPKGALNRRLRSVMEAMESQNFNPFEEKLKLALQLRNKLHRNHFDSPEQKTTYISIYAEVLRDLIQYAAPKLKQVEHFAHIEIIQRLQSLDQYSDPEIEALLTEARDLANGA